MQNLPSPPPSPLRPSRFRPLKTQEIIDRGRQMMRRVPVALRLVLAATALVALLAFNAVLSVGASEQVFAEQQQLREALRMEKRLSNVLSLSKDIETGIRGFFITGNRQFLDPYQKALALLPIEILDLANATHGDVRLSDLTTRLNQQVTLLIQQSQLFFGRRVALGGQVTMQDFRPLLEDQKDVMDRLRQSAEMLREEHSQVTAQLDERLQVMRRDQRLLIILPNLLLLALALFIFTILLRDNRNAQLMSLEREKSLSIEREARGEAEAANQAKDDFVSVVSHELRTPLQAILGWSQFLNRALGNREQIAVEPLRAPVAATERAAHALARMIDDLLDVSRALTGKLALRPQATDFGTLVREALETLAAAAQAKRVQLVPALSAEPLNLVGDPDRLRQVVSNIVGNAIKFTPAEGIVRVSAQRVGSSIELKVTDTGVGIQPELLPRVFDRYVQASSTSTRQYGGLGLGLAIVKHLVEMHGGQVEASSPGAGQGAAFLVRLPIAAVAPIAEPNPANAPIAAETPLRVVTPVAALPPQRLGGKVILVVDDDGDVRNVLTLLLGDEGAVVKAAATASEALTVLASTAVDVVISDIGMPEMDGYAFARTLRASNPETLVTRPDVPLVALTAFSRPEDLKRSRECGFDGHLAKPVEFEKLVAILLTLPAKG